MSTFVRIYCISLLSFFHISFVQTDSKLMTLSATDTSNDTKEITITFIVPEKDFIYKDFITCSVHEPTVILSPWKANKQSISHYDPSFKETKQVFNETFSVFMTATTKKYSPDPVYLYCSYYRRSEKKINHTLFTLFFPQPVQQSESVDEDVLEVPTHTTHQKNIFPYIASIDDYFFTALSMVHSFVGSLKTDYKKYVFALIALMILLASLSYLFKEQLQKQKKLNELIEVLFSLLIVSGTTYALVYLYTISTPLITMAMACSCTSGAGFFYIKKSTKLHSGYLRTLCTFIGMLWIIGALFLSFKALQYADDQFHFL
ncbi:MAG TPA: hypothetical protein VJJ26_04345 [Candidatus Babeliales bacterium]|nr:hypothetical protein [Candidatus Babeliales bacterium]